MTLKVPVLACSNSATSELIDNNKNGLIVDNSIDGIYMGLKKIINNRELLINWKQSLKDYTYEANNKRIIKEVENILK